LNSLKYTTVTEIRCRQLVNRRFKIRMVTPQNAVRQDFLPKRNGDKLSLSLVSELEKKTSRFLNSV